MGYIHWSSEHQECWILELQFQTPRKNGEQTGVHYMVNSKGILTQPICYIENTLGGSQALLRFDAYTCRRLHPFELSVIRKGREVEQGCYANKRPLGLRLKWLKRWSEWVFSDESTSESCQITNQRDSWTGELMWTRFRILAVGQNTSCVCTCKDYSQLAPNWLTWLNKG